VNREAAHGQSNATVLVCEDDDQLRTLVDVMLSGHGYRVLLSARAEEALELAAAHAGAIDVLVTDVHLPQMSGPELVERLRTTQPSFDVLFLSGYPADMIPRRAVPGGSEFLRKPFDEHALVQSIDSLLDAHKH
jgi:CheY-like chemotaxis protein